MEDTLPAEPSDVAVPWAIHRGEGAVVATAIHEGHQVRPDVEAALALEPAVRRREEDPFTSEWTQLSGNRIVVHRSRFEVDLNRPREGAVYRTPEQAWGLEVWKGGTADGLVEASLELYDTFYAEVEELLSELRDRHGRFVVYDLHSYNHRREGPRTPPADPRRNPEINVGTGTMDRERWGPVVDAFVRALSSAKVLGRTLDVRENVRFQGGHFSRWVHETFPESGCCLAIEVKKFYMDEWSGAPDEARIQAVGEALRRTVPEVLEALEKV